MYRRGCRRPAFEGDDLSNPAFFMVKVRVLVKVQLELAPAGWLRTERKCRSFHAGLRMWEELLGLRFVSERCILSCSCRSIAGFIARAVARSKALLASGRSRRSRDDLGVQRGSARKRRSATLNLAQHMQRALGGLARPLSMRAKTGLAVCTR